MAESTTNKANGRSKSFMTAGPTLHYSHTNVRLCWALGILFYLATCFFWSKITGATAPGDTTFLLLSRNPSLGKYIVSPISIFEYPWQILVLGTLMGIIGTVPVVTSQLLRFKYSIPMILGVLFIANMPLFSLVLVISCVAVACRPLRFRSRFIAIALCMAPQIIYWGILGGLENVDPIRWGFSYAPWVLAWLTGLAIAGIVIGIGHFTRYRPGLVWSVCAVYFIVTIIIFQLKIGFPELDYQLYIARNNPEEVREFHDHNMKPAIDSAMEDPSTRSFLAGFFYPTEPILLRKELKREIQVQLDYGRWPSWFLRIMPEELKYQEKRQELVRTYDLFINKHPNSKRMPIALYYKAMLNEFRPDIHLLGQSEILRFHSDYPDNDNLHIWHKLSNEFSNSPESLEARWRIAVYWAGHKRFTNALETCKKTIADIEALLEDYKTVTKKDNNIWTVFSPPSQTVMTQFKLNELTVRFRMLESLINGQNHTDDDLSQQRLAQFISLNPYSRDYTEKLDRLMADSYEGDPLIDNILLAKIMAGTDIEVQVRQLNQLINNYVDKDGGIQALYELGKLLVGVWKDPSSSEEEKQSYLAQAKQVLKNLTEKYPESIYKEQAQKLLDSLPTS